MLVVISGKKFFALYGVIKKQLERKDWFEEWPLLLVCTSFNNVSVKNSDDLSSLGDIVMSEDTDKWKPLKYIGK